MNTEKFHDPSFANWKPVKKVLQLIQSLKAWEPTKLIMSFML